MDAHTVDLFYRFIRFALVGTSGLAVDFGLTYFFKEKAKINKYLANGIGFVCAATSNFFLNRMWTFESTDPQVGRQYLSFLVISLLGLAMNQLIVLMAHGRLKVNFYRAKAVAIGVVMVWNFTANFFLTFR